MQLRQEGLARVPLRGSCGADVSWRLLHPTSAFFHERCTDVLWVPHALGALIVDGGIDVLEVIIGVDGIDGKVRVSIDMTSITILPTPLPHPPSAVVVVPHVERRSALGVEASASKCGVSSASNHGRTVNQSL